MAGLQVQQIKLLASVQIKRLIISRGYKAKIETFGTYTNVGIPIFLEVYKSKQNETFVRDKNVDLKTEQN